MLLAGIIGAAKDSSFPPLPPRAGNGIRLAFNMSTDSEAGAVPMFTIRLPTWRGFAPARSPVNNTASRGQSDTLEVAVVVDEKGVPLLGTVNVVRAPPRRTFALTYLDWFRESRFVPGHIQQCAFRSLIHVKGMLTIESRFVPAP